MNGAKSTDTTTMVWVEKYGVCKVKKAYTHEGKIGLLLWSEEFGLTLERFIGEVKFLVSVGSS